MQANQQYNNNMQKASVPSRCALMKNIYETGFTLDDLILYLDTHPGDREALAYYQKMRREYHELMKLYTLNYGPLLAKNVECDNYFTWVNRPMPWEGDV